MLSFNKNEAIGPYTIAFPIKEGRYAETYRVKDASGKNYFLKLINYAKLSRHQYNENGEVTELVISKTLSHPNMISYHDSGELLSNGSKLLYLVYEFISGETLSQKIMREQTCSVYDAKTIVSGVLNGLKMLHSGNNPTVHNEITADNIMLDLSKAVLTPKIIDFGKARHLSQGKETVDVNDLNPFYSAPELQNGIFTPQSDIFSVGALLYHLLFGLPPHFIDLSEYKGSRQKLQDAVLEEQRKPLRIPRIDIYGLDEQLINTIGKALATDIDNRFKNVDEFLQALNGEIKVETITSQPLAKPQHKAESVKKGNGFADVAGMEELKAQLQSDVIDLLENPDQAEALGLHLPNGLLFYGPPGCGKTYFAEKFAEEIGCHYMYVKCSDVASPYIHGGQEKIAKIFDEARAEAPSILFFDEIDAMIKDRNKHTNVSEAGEVNEFLAQLNNCGHDGVIVIGATNKPTELDEAALRAGRLELKYYIPQPDLETRKQMFIINLKKRKTDFGIDYDKLAELTENYISADIRLIVDTAARLVFRRKLDKISMDILEEAISTIKPSLTLEMIRKHEEIRDAFEGKAPIEKPRKKIGF